ncbi:hypothetical protein BVX93_02020, partial [bacterium B13(2017)]
LDDSDKARINIPIQLRPGLNNIKIPYSRIASKIDASNIEFIVLFLNNPTRKYELYFDNLRLESSDLIEGIDLIPSSKNSELIAIKLKNVKDNTPLISSGIPFPKGQLKDKNLISFYDNQNNPIPIGVKILARWPGDLSIRSILVQFPLYIKDKYEYIKMILGEKRETKDLEIIEPVWDYPEGFIQLSAKWLCESGVIGEQIPMGVNIFPKYDENIIKFFPYIQSLSSGYLQIDNYYSTSHVFYQFYVRSGELKYFLSARKELINYRDTQIIQDGKNRGCTIVSKKPRYIYLQAMADDYFLTGDPKSLLVASYMAEFLEKTFKPKKAFYAKKRKNFWTERLYAFPFLGCITYYEMTHEKKYLEIADEYMKNLYKTQLEWPKRGGFIHNLYAHDPEEGARPDEYGGSPFMTGLLLEAIIKYHRITKSKIAKDSIFLALDWLINEALTEKKDSFIYLTADKYKNSNGEADLNLLIVHAFGYGYIISDKKRKDYLEIGKNLFIKGINKAYLGKRKHFNQNYRSSGHFLAYVISYLNNEHHL